MTRGQRERHKMTCRRLILAVLVVIVAIIATAAVKGNTGQQEGQADEGGAGWRVEIDSEAIEPVSVEPIGPVQGGTEEAQGH